MFSGDWGFPQQAKESGYYPDPACQFVNAQNPASLCAKIPSASKNG